MAASAGQIIGDRLKEAMDAGTYIPAFYLQQKYVDPKTGQETRTADIVARIFMNFENELMRPGSRTLLEITNHELLPENDQTRKIRKDWYQRQAADKIPTLLNKEIARIQSLVSLDQDQLAARTAQRRAAAEPEPRSASTGLPQGATGAQLLARAEELARQNPQFAGASGGDKQAMIITQLHRLRKPQP